MVRLLFLAFTLIVASVFGEQITNLPGLVSTSLEIKTHPQSCF